MERRVIEFSNRLADLKGDVESYVGRVIMFNKDIANSTGLKIEEADGVRSVITREGFLFRDLAADECVEIATRVGEMASKEKGLY